jgi:hypothetical protein
VGHIFYCFWIAGNKIERAVKTYLVSKALANGNYNEAADK